MKVKILLVDDHKMVRAGLCALMTAQRDFTVVGEAADGRSAVNLVAQLSPDVVVMDLRMPDLNGIEAARQILAANANVKVVAISGHVDEQAAVEMLEVGAAAYVRKDATFEELASAIRTVMENKVYLSPSVTGPLLEQWKHAHENRNGNAFSILTGREREVLQLIAEGHATKEVAAHLSVSIKTVETHRLNIMGKLRIDSVAELTKYAVRQGLTSL